MQSIKSYGSNYHVSVPRIPNKHLEEASIREVKCTWYRIIHKKKVPPRLWENGLVWFCETVNIVSISFKYTDGKTPLEMVTGNTPEMS